MNNAINLLWHAVTPVHVGTGQDGAGLIDLPVAREAATGFPILPASSIKGTHRSETNSEKDSDGLFGTVDASGSLTFTDARLAALAVPSYKGVFALVTCPMVIRRLHRDRLLLLPEYADKEDWSLLMTIGDDVAVAADKLVYEEKLWLQDFGLRVSQVAEQKDALRNWAEALLKGQSSNKFDVANIAQERICLVSDQVFSFLCAASLDISPHIRVDPDTGTVARGALWWEECIPSESLLTSFVISRDPKDLKDFNEGKLRRIGGKATVGRGLMHVKAIEEAAA